VSACASLPPPLPLPEGGGVRASCAVASLTVPASVLVEVSVDESSLLHAASMQTEAATKTQAR
jgi:hypothetical protein